MPHRPDVIAGRYRVLEEAGRGGMGAVYRCADERLGRDVAVKQVGRTPGESVTDQARALREARSTAALNHPHVVSVYDAVAEDDHLWLVMEYVPGRTLAQIMREDGPLSPMRAARIIVQVADGLAAAHERGTVHRDVKPGNILVAEGDVAKISDFGIARTTGDATLTHTGMLSGTPAYLSPEVARGEDPSPAADVWGLGATLFAAVEGRPLFENNNSNALALLATIAAVKEPPSPERAGPLAGPIRDMLDPDPTSRWSMADVVSALHRLQEQPAPDEETREETPVLAAAGPAAAPEPAAVPAPARSPRRRIGSGALLVAGLVTLLAMLMVGLVLFGDDPESSPTADGPSGAESSPTASDSEPENTPDSTPDETEPTTEEPAETADSAPAGAANPTAFVEDYYAVLPEDTRAGYALLSPSYQEDTSFADYDGFWSTVDDVGVQETSPAGPGTVDVTLLYNGSDEEVRRIYLEKDENSWLIADDEIIG